MAMPEEKRPDEEDVEGHRFVSEDQTGDDVEGHVRPMRK
jgi:hypothetical protein